MYEQDFKIASLHPLCNLESTRDFLETTLAAAANDNAGAYSKTLRDATASQKRKIALQFQELGDFYQFNLISDACTPYEDRFFSNWFYGVAWDWCLIATWPKQKIIWMGCLTDTD